MTAKIAIDPIPYNIDRRNGYVILNPGRAEIVVTESDLIAMLADLQADDSTIAELSAS